MANVDAWRKVKTRQHRSRTCAAKFGAALNRVAATEMLRAMADAFRLHAWKRPPAKAGAGFKKIAQQRDGRQLQSHRAVRHTTKPGSPK
jgi:hypothetical protein